MDPTTPDIACVLRAPASEIDRDRTHFDDEAIDWLVDAVVRLSQRNPPDQAEVAVAVLDFARKMAERYLYRITVPDELRAAAMNALSRAENVLAMAGTKMLNASAVVRASADLAEVSFLVTDTRIMIGAKSVSGAKRGGANANAKHREYHADYQPYVDDLCAKGETYERAVRLAAKHFGYSERTIKRRTTNRTPKNRGGQKKKPKR